MGRKRFTAEQIIGKLREAKILLAKGQNVGQVSRALGITEQTYYRWRKEYGGLKVTQAKRLKELERENARLRKAVSDLTLDKLILKEALEGNYRAPSAVGAVWGVSWTAWACPSAGPARCWSSLGPASVMRQRCKETGSACGLRSSSWPVSMAATAIAV